MTPEEFHERFFKTVMRGFTMYDAAKANARTLIKARAKAGLGFVVLMSEFAIDYEAAKSKFDKFKELITLDAETPYGLYIISVDQGAAYNGAGIGRADGFTVPLGVIEGTYDTAVMSALLLEPCARIFRDMEDGNWSEDDLMDLIQVQHIVDATAVNQEFSASIPMTLDEFFDSKVELQGSAEDATGFDFYRGVDATVFSHGEANTAVLVVLDHDLGSYFVHYGDAKFEAGDEIQAVQAAYFVYLTALNHLNEDELVEHWESLMG